VIVTEDDARALWRLRNRWMGTYMITLPRGLWQAIRYGAQESLTAGTASELGRKIQQDYDGLTAQR
jgi:hypothetical protein